jgi:hypothetical protein
MPKENIESALDKVFRRLASVQILSPNCILEEVNADLAQPTARSIRTAVRLLSEYRKKQHLGRLRAALLVGAVLFGKSFLIKAERAGSLLSDDMPPKSFDDFLKNLCKEVENSINADWRFLGDRLKTYLLYHRLTQDLTADSSTRKRLRQQPRKAIAQVIRLTQLAFLRRHFGVEIGKSLELYLDTFGAPETLAGIASLLFALANEQHALDSYDFAYPMAEPLTQDIRDFMEYGKARYHQLEVAKYISLFGYTLSIPDHTTRPIYELRPPTAEFEYALRLGFIRSEIGQSKIPLDISRHGSAPRISLLAFAEALSTKQRDKLYEIKEEIPEARRFRLMIPVSSALFKQVAEEEFYEDFFYYAELSRDFMTPVIPDGETEIMLTEQLNLTNFYRMWRQMQFISLLDIFGLKQFAKEDRTILFNSLLRVIEEKELIDLLCRVGVKESEAREFLDLVAADVYNLRYFDIQYRPLLRIAPWTDPNSGAVTKSEIVYISGLVYLSNVLRNIQFSNQIRLKSSAGMFVENVVAAFQSKFHKVAANRPVGLGAMKTDIDVVLLESNKLFIFECKYSLPPTDPHEMRDLWEEIEQGVTQLDRAKHILSDPKRRQSYLASWFPGTVAAETETVEIVPCILCSHRIFSGMKHNGIPIRDFSILALMLSEGIVGFGGMNESGESFMYEHRIVSETGFNARDLTDFLSDDSSYFKMFASSARRFWQLDRLGDITLARDTYMHDFDSDTWLANMESLGFKRLPNKREQVEFPLSVEQLLTNLDQK